MYEDIELDAAVPAKWVRSLGHCRAQEGLSGAISVPGTRIQRHFYDRISQFSD